MELTQHVVTCQNIDGLVTLLVSIRVDLAQIVIAKYKNACDKDWATLAQAC
jgi:hypothetical protein